MTDETVIIGVDFDGPECRLAVVDSGAGRLEQLIACPASQLADYSGTLNAGRVVLPVPTNHVLVKNLRLGDDGRNRFDRAAFELAQAVLADERDFVFDVLPTGLTDHLLGLAVRRETVDRMVGDRMVTAAGQVAPGHYRASAVALGLGFLHYAAPASAEPVAITADTDGLISIGIVHRGHIVALGHLDASRLETETPSGRERFAVELKTVIDFRLASLFDLGLTLPLAGMQVTGKAFDTELIEVLESYFRVAVSRPGWRAGMNLPPGLENDTQPGAYLVALGLTVN